MAEQLSFKLRRKGKTGRTVRGRIKKGFYLSPCSGTLGKAKPKRRKRSTPTSRRRRR